MYIYIYIYVRIYIYIYTYILYIKNTHVAVTTCVTSGALAGWSAAPPGVSHRCSCDYYSCYYYYCYYYFYYYYYSYYYCYCYYYCWLSWSANTTTTHKPQSAINMTNQHKQLTK